MDEQTAGRLELTAARARALLGGSTSGGGRSPQEATEGGPQGPGESDAARLAVRIGRDGSIAPDAATAIAADLVARAKAAMTALNESTSNATLTDAQALALESVIYVRGRPALRVLDTSLESLALHPGSELWQNLIGDYETLITAAAAATGAAIVNAPILGYPPWTHGSAWLVAPNRVVTNRHVLALHGVSFLESTQVGSGQRLRNGIAIVIEFAGDDRKKATTIPRVVTDVLYVAAPEDPVDIAVLAIDPYDDPTPLELTEAGKTPPNNLFVVGHPGVMADTPADVKAVFGEPDGRKRVSFGKRLDIPGLGGVLVHDASTIGGYSGGPVVGISSGLVAGLHYYGDPASGNLAVAADTLRAHAAAKHLVKGNGP